MISGSDPARSIHPVEPSDDLDIPGGPARRLVVETTGTLAVVYGDGTSETLTAAFITFVGGVLDCEIKRVKKTGTTATGLWGYL